MKDNLKLMNKDEEWVMKELKNRGLQGYEKILLMTLDPTGDIYIYEKNISSDTKIFE